MFVFFNQILSVADMLSGGERIVVELLKDEYPMTVALPHRKSWLIMKEFPKANFKINKAPFKADKKYLVVLNWVVLSVSSLRFKIKDDIITSSDYFCNTIPAFVLKGKNKWTAYLFHIIPRGRKIPWLMQQFSLLLMLRADMIVVLNSMVKDYLIKRGFKAQRIFIQEVGVDEKSIKQVKKQPKIYDACFMGRLSPSKGIFDLPNIWQGQKGKLLVIGGGGFAKDVDKFNQSCGENIIRVGHKEGEEKYRLIKQSKVFIFPSYEEGLSLTIKEVLACGVPIIAWDLPVYKALYGNKITTVSIGDIEKFREKVKEALCVR